MIQVLQRTFGILEHLSALTSKSVKELAEATGLKKSTLCNILKTLTDLGYAVKVHRGEYKLGSKLAELARSRFQPDALVRLGREAVVALADATGETAQLAVLRNGERHILVEARCRQGLTVNTAALGRSVFGSATGRVLLAHLHQGKLQEFARHRNSSISDMKPELSKVRDGGLSIVRPGDGQVVGLGVPVFAAAGKVQAALGVYLPAVRFRGTHRKEVVGFLRKAGTALSLRLSAELGETPFRPVETDQSFRR